MQSKILCIALHAFINLPFSGMELWVFFQVSLGRKWFPTIYTKVSTKSWMLFKVERQVRVLHKSFPAHRTHERFIIPVQHLVILQTMVTRQTFTTNITFILLEYSIGVLQLDVMIVMGFLFKFFTAVAAREHLSCLVTF